MLRDGINLKERKYTVTQKFRTNIREMSFQSLVRLLDHIAATGDYSYLQQIRDPYALMLILGIKKPVIITEAFDDTPSQQDIPCELVWSVLHSDSDVKIDNLNRRLNVMERHYLKKIASGFHPEGIASKDAFRELSLVRQFDYDDAYYVWVLQPDVEAISFSIISDMTSNDSLTETQRLTPTAGRFIQPMNFVGGNNELRFPCIVSPFRVYQRVQIHISCGSYIVFDEMGKEIDIELPKWENDGVLDAFWDGNELYIFDILCLNDVWLYARPLSERIKLLWRFFPKVETIITVQNKKELENLIEKWDIEKVFARNLNSTYCPLNKKAWCIYGKQHVVQLQIAAKGGKNTFYYLVTSDKVPIFTFGTNRINPGEKGKVVDVNRSGDVLSYRFDLKEGLTFDEVARAWNLSSPDDIELDENNRPPIITWKNLKKLM